MQTSMDVYFYKQNKYLPKKSRNGLKKTISENGLKVYKISIGAWKLDFFIIWSVLSVVDLVSTRECKSFKKSKKKCHTGPYISKTIFFRPITLMEPKKSLFWDDDFFFYVQIWH